MRRLLRACLILACLPAALPAATATEKSPASQKLLAAYRQDDPAGVARAARSLADKGNPEAQFILGLLLDIGAGVPIDHAGARTWLEKAAAQKHDGAMLLLAWRTQTGFGLPRADAAEAARWRARAGPVADDAFAPWLTKGAGGFEPDLSRAFLWMIDAADGGNVAAMRNLAECYLVEFWTASNLGEHVRWLERASDAGNAESMVVLSVYYETGSLVPADPAKALALRRRAAESGFALGQFVLGNQYEQGRGVPQDYSAALTWYTKAAKQDNVAAIIRLIELRRTGVPAIPRDFQEAARLAERGHALGDATCTRHLADLYNRGDGVKRDVPRSAALYQEAAAGGDGPATTMLGWIARTGQEGRVDHSAARRWFDRAADLGEVRAMWELGQMYELGQGAGPDLSIAFSYYERAARRGDANAQDKLGRMLLAGQGLPVDPDEAVNWFRLAARNTPVTSLAPKLRPWGYGPELAKGVDGLISVARDENDPWLLDNLVAAFAGDPLSRGELEPKIIRLLDEPGLLAVPGILPEACLAVLESDSVDAKVRQLAQDWFQKLLAADRLQSALWLGQHALDGRFMPPDAARALRWAKVASASGWKGAVLLAEVENTTSADPAQRAQAAATLEKFAAQGDPDAAQFIATHRAVGSGDAARLLAGFAGAPAGPTEAELAARAEQMVKARKAGSDCPPQVLARAAPRYPFELRQENISGSVVVEFVINEDGRTQDFRVVRSTDRRFEPEAVAAVSQWRFVAGWTKGRPVKVRASQLLEFNADTVAPPGKK